jgi:hypothetical protein
LLLRHVLTEQNTPIDEGIYIAMMGVKCDSDAQSPWCAPKFKTDFFAREHKMSLERDVLSIKEAARFLRVRVSRVSTLLATNQIIGKNLGTASRPQWRIHRSELVRFLTDFRHPDPPEPRRSTKRLQFLPKPPSFI